MRHHGFWGITYYCFQGLQYATFAATAMVGATSKVEMKFVPNGLYAVVEYLKANAGFWVVVLGFMATTFKFAADKIGPPWVWESLQKILNAFREEAFNLDDKREMHRYRVTIFKKVRFRLHRRACRSWKRPLEILRDSYSGWLVPVARSGHIGKKTNTVFFAPDDADKAEGVAGYVWAGESSLVVAELPDVRLDPSPEMIAEYAARAFVSEDWVRRRLSENRICSRSICCFYLEVKYKPWGVLVLDSTEPAAINSKKHSWLVFERISPVILDQLLRRA